MQFNFLQLQLIGKKKKRERDFQVKIAEYNLKSTLSFSNILKSEKKKLLITKSQPHGNRKGNSVQI